jgi:hypothetical protein
MMCLKTSIIDETHKKYVGVATIRIVPKGRREE